VERDVSNINFQGVYQMSQSKFIFSFVRILFISLFCISVSLAQPEDNQMPKAEPSFDVIMQTMVASNNSSDQSTLPQTLSGVVKKLKSTYPLSNYNLTSTYLQRIANTGNLELKSVSSQTYQDISSPVFSEWTLGQFLTLPNAQGTSSIQVRNFRFNQRVPIKNPAGKDAEGKPAFSTVYESIGMTMQKISLSENVPTVIGSLTTSRPDEIMFLILTVKSSEN
jgi:hypothetical protein